MKRQPRPDGFSLAELLFAMAVLALLSSVALVNARPQHQRQQLESASQRFQLAIDRARLKARRDQQPCGLGLTPAREASQGLRACASGGHPLPATDASAGVQVHTNMPNQLRFTANGLLLDGGLVVFSHPRARQRLCVVVSLPLGVSRGGHYGTDPALGLSSQHCRPAS